MGGASGLGMPLPEEQHGPAGAAPEADTHLCSGSAGPSGGCAALRGSQDDVGKA